MLDEKIGKRDKKGDWSPSYLFSYGPLFELPFKPITIVKWMFAIPGFIFPWLFFYGVMGLLIYLFLTPDFEVAKDLNFSWMYPILIRNFLIIFIFFGFLHMRLYIFQSQKNLFKYHAKFSEGNKKKFLFGNQVYDNMAYSLISGSFFITFYEVIALWLYSNNFFYFSSVNWNDNLIYCVILLFLLPIYKDAHFYLGHRFVHTRPLYKYAHYVHHKNLNPIPWSGLAMHPIEHFVYFSFFIIFFIIPSHPVHFYYLMGIYILAPAVHGHSGFEKLLVNDKEGVMTGGHAHYLHHKYFECNYGDGNLPLDKWFGTHHDGSEEAQIRMIKRMKQRRKNAG